MDISIPLVADPTLSHSVSEQSSYTERSSEDITIREQALDIMKNRIEKMGKPQHIEILNILKKNPTVKLNENRNGVYINLSYLPDDVVDEIQKYLDYLKDQESNLEQMEIQKEEFKTTIGQGAESLQQLTS